MKKRALKDSIARPHYIKVKDLDWNCKAINEWADAGYRVVNSDIFLNGNGGVSVVALMEYKGK